MSDFLLAHDVITAHGSAPTRTVFVLHGIYGTGRNWAGFARRYVAARPDQRVVLVHLRGHGGSRDAPPPHTMSACAADLARLAQEIGPPDTIWGHSFGGKVALTWVRDAKPESLSAVWSLDSPPGAGPAGGGDEVSSEVGRVLTFIEELPDPIVRRSDAQEHLIERGLSRAVAGWMATNLVPVEGGFGWHFERHTLAALLEDYWREDLWPIADAPPEGLEVHLVRAANSDRWTSEDIAHLDALAHVDGTTVHVLANAGHWLHVDAPDALLALLSA